MFLLRMFLPILRLRIFRKASALSSQTPLCILVLVILSLSAIVSLSVDLILRILRSCPQDHPSSLRPMLLILCPSRLRSL